MTLLTQTVNSVSVSNRFDIGSGRPFTLIAGPCVIESERMIMQVAENLKQVCLDLGIHLIFKSSFDKANRTSLDSPRGVGMDEGLRILQKVKTELDLPLITDVHESWQCAPVPYRDWETDRKSTRLNSSHSGESRMPSSA